MSPNGPLRIGIGGPVGAGKTTLTGALARLWHPARSVAVITNDIYTQEDAEALMRLQILPATGSSGSRPAAAPIPRSARTPRSTSRRSTRCAAGTRISTWC